MSNQQNEDLIEKAWEAGYEDGFKEGLRQVNFIMGYLLAHKNNWKKINEFINEELYGD